ncbi:site-specific integrase [Streptomyces sp. NPDC049915]|uniref:site-specific integrase n=1 Tax=Streptomyces sp. NPDC049915 TaxID=3155510 RepID=UPI0034306492
MDAAVHYDRAAMVRSPDRRLRGGNGAIPLVTSYDVHERVWNPPMPLLFQRDIGTEHRAFTPTALRKLLINALAVTGLTDADGEPLVFSPHDFRRIFVTDAIMNGLPPHIAQVICGHRSLDTTMGYKAIYPAETIEAHRAFIARRRATRPSEGYRTPLRRNGTHSSRTSRSGPLTCRRPGPPGGQVGDTKFREEAGTKLTRCLGWPRSLSGRRVGHAGRHISPIVSAALPGRLAGSGSIGCARLRRWLAQNHIHDCRISGGRVTHSE